MYRKDAANKVSRCGGPPLIYSFFFILGIPPYIKRGARCPDAGCGHVEFGRHAARRSAQRACVRLRPLHLGTSAVLVPTLLSPGNMVNVPSPVLHRRQFHMVRIPPFQFAVVRGSYLRPARRASRRLRPARRRRRRFHSRRHFRRHGRALRGPRHGATRLS